MAWAVVAAEFAGQAAFAVSAEQAMPTQPNASATKARVTDLCDIFADLRSYAGGVMAVSGIIEQSKEVFALRAPNCAHRFKTGELVWPPAISIGESGSISPVERRHLGELSDRANSLQKSVSLRVTLQGVLRVRNRYEVRRTSSRLVGNGFGHMGTFAAELLVERVVKVEEVGQR